ncbi:MAG: hypothetical protein QNL76_11710 [Octadecabacter sp.]
MAEKTAFQETLQLIGFDTLKISVLTDAMEMRGLGWACNEKA